MIEIITASDANQKEEEYQAALDLKRFITEVWPDVYSSPDDRIYILPSAICHAAAKVEEIDILVFGELREKLPFPSGSQSPSQPQYFIKSFCLVIEVKSHSLRGVQVNGSHLEVRYQGKWKSATIQSREQQLALRAYLEGNGIDSPFVTNLIWMRQLPAQHLKKFPNALGMEARWEDFLKTTLGKRKLHPNSDGEIVVHSTRKGNSLAAAIDLFTKKLVPTDLDRRKMEEISKTVLRDQKYSLNIGKQLLIFQGRGGTGKTVHLLKIAHDLFQQQNAQVLILTYHRALVSDLSRILALMELGGSATTRRIRIESAYAFFYGLCQDLGVLVDNQDFLDRFEIYKTEALELLRKYGRDQLLKMAPKKEDARLEAFYWDYVFVDEGQDWPQNERDLIYELYSPDQVVVADGLDQLVRGPQALDWANSHKVKQKQRVTLSKSLRLKSSLCYFVQSIARQVGLGDLNLQPEPNAYGGRIIILVGQYAESRELHQTLLKENSKAGNHPVDMLFCVPPALAKTKNQIGKKSTVAQQFTKWGYEVWDGVNDIVRRGYPTSLNQLRIVQYHSCRGLEGWTVVNLQLDSFYDHIIGTYRGGEPEKADLSFDEQKAAQLFAWRWLLIPLTRAMDTLVIQVKSPNHPVTKILRKIHAENKDLIEWKEIGVGDLAVSKS